jgi:hypothetical protein
MEKINNMKKHQFKKYLGVLATLTGVIPSSYLLTQCKKNNSDDIDEDSNYVGNAEGTD